jgi:hypothetical protein
MLAIGVLGFFCFSTVSLIFTFYPDTLKRSVRHRELEGFISYTLFSGLLLLYSCLIVYYFRKRLLVTNTEVIQCGFFGTQKFAIEDVTHIAWPQCPGRKWPYLPASTVVVQTESATIKIDFGSFTRVQGQEIILFFRNRFPVEKQENWAQFVEHAPYFSPPIYLALPRAPHLPFSRIFFLVTAVIWMLFSAAFIYCWLIQQGIEYLIIGIICVLAGIGFFGRYLTYKIKRDAEENKVC